jgi:hypothetical protein
MPDPAGRLSLTRAGRERAVRELVAGIVAWHAACLVRFVSHLAERTGRGRTPARVETTQEAVR